MGTASDSDIDAMLIEWAGGIENIGRNTNLGRTVRSQYGVAKSREWKRINALPRRRWESAPDLAQLCDLLTRYMRPEGFTPTGDTERDMPLRPVQAAILRDAAELKGAVGPIRVGGGKTLVSALAPELMGAERPILLVRSRLVKKTLKALDHIRKIYRVHPELRVISYEDLSRAKNENLLWELRPDLIISDEAHRIKYGARRKRVEAYFNDFPQTMYLPMSGTLTKRSLKDMHHHFLWAMKPRLCPLPIHWPTLTDWSDAVDSLKKNELERRVAPGALLDWCEEGETPRQGLHRRLVETPGIVASLLEDDCNASITITKWPARLPAELSGAIAKLRSDWETPNGDICAEAVDVWRHARELSSGFYYRWDPPAPREWMDARRAWNSFVRHITKRGRWNGQRADSRLLVENIASRLTSQPDEYREWVRVRDSFKPNTVAEWVSYDVVEAAVEWLLRKKEPPGICWVEHVEAQKEIAKRAGVELYGAGRDDIEEATGPIVASIAAQAEGNNLQHSYHRNLIFAPPSSGDTWEQLIGRTHRFGQKADDVSFEVALPCDDLRDSFAQALADSRYLNDVQGPQKLCVADITIEGLTPPDQKTTVSLIDGLKGSLS